MSCLGIAARVPRSTRSTSTRPPAAKCRHPAAEAARLLAGRLGCSQRQARRYVALAATGGRVPVPDEGTVFTVRLPVRLAAAVRDHARVRPHGLGGRRAGPGRISRPCSRGPSGQVRELAVETDASLSPCRRRDVSGLRDIGAAAAGQDRRPGGGRRRR